MFFFIMTLGLLIPQGATVFSRIGPADEHTP
ncbi:MAG: hypothetical protein ACI8S3_002090, partial [Alphaproteobacteria bacterium]